MFHVKRRILQEDVGDDACDGYSDAVEKRVKGRAAPCEG